jgi:hypothetical protein
MTQHLKRIEYQLNVQVPADTNLDWLHKIIIATLDGKECIDITGLYLVKEEDIGEVIK